MKILTIIGARPQFIKAAAICHVVQRMAGIEEVLVHTGQHYDENMSDVFFAELKIPRPRHSLAIGSGSHGLQTGRMLERIEEVLLQEKPDVVLVYGDTNSTIAGALAACKLHIPIAHVEAGLRSFNRRMPEEVNRVLTDHVSTWLFAPTQAAVANLAREGIAGDKVMLVGDVMYDVAAEFDDAGAQQLLTSLGVQAGHYVLATIHRAENTDSVARLRTIFSALTTVSASLPVVLPVHPRTRAALQREAIWKDCSQQLRLIDPVGYRDMVRLERNACVIATDSGGVQKEAFFHRVPCVTLRQETEWVELVELGWNRLVSPDDPDAIRASVLAAMSEPHPAAPPDLYGGGQAASRIVHCLQSQAA